MAFAIGTDVAHMAGKSLISTMRHSKFGNVDYRMGLIMVFGTIGGFEIGAQMIMWLERIGEINIVVRWLYVVLLTLIAWMVFADVAKRRRKEREALASGQKLDPMATGLEWHKKLHKIKIPPMITLRFRDSLLALAADQHQLPDGMASRHPGYRRRTGPHAGFDLSDWSSNAHSRRHGPV